MDLKIPIYLSTVCLEKNRWGSREPSFKVSEWTQRLAEDGFDGIELWEFHYLLADDAEKAKLTNLDMPMIYNSYVGFEDVREEDRRKTAQAIQKMQPRALKYNLGHDQEKMDEYRRNLLSWAEMIPSDCQMLCECHEGTVLENVAAAGEFHRELNTERFGIIVHLMAVDKLREWFDVFGNRINEIHMQFRSPESDPCSDTGREHLEMMVPVLKEFGFSGNATIEFTRGIGREENIHELYANACSDLYCCREFFQ